MGNSQSSPSKNETRRANRLSKPLTKKSAALSSPQLQSNPADAPTGLVGWQTPWDYNVSRSFHSSYSRVGEGAPPLLRASSTPWERSGMNASQRDDQNRDSVPPSPASLSASPSMRRASCQSGPAGSSSQLSLAPHPPRRANSIQTPLPRNRGVIYENTFQDATSSNTHFLVGNQRFSLIRRRSLLTRPGVATRRTTGTIRRMPSPIGEPESPVEESAESKALDWPLPPRQRPPLHVAPQARSTSPTDARYTQLGALKLGSLRVVNGSASPCPSERIRLEGSETLPSESGLGLGHVEPRYPRDSMLDIPAVADAGKLDDVPGSPFSFEKSPTLAVHSRSKPNTPLLGEMEDEGIGMCDEGIEKSNIGVGIDRSTSRSLNKSDSGYSSATSVRSFRRSKTRASLDSQASSSYAGDSTKNLGIPNNQLGYRPGHKVQRHLSLQETKPGNYSRLHPTSTRWHESSDPMTQPLSGFRERRSTYCAPKFSESGTPTPAFPESSFSASGKEDRFISGQKPLRSDRFPPGMFGATQGPNTRTMETYAGHHQFARMNASPQIHRAASERRAGVRHETLSTRSRSRSRPGGRVWCQIPGVEVPPLPTILSPDCTPGGKETDDALPSLPEPHRGRPRSRSQDCRRRRLTKAQPMII